MSVNKTKGENGFGGLVVYHTVRFGGRRNKKKIHFGFTKYK